MKRIDNPERDEGDRRRSSVDGHTDWGWVLGQERIWDYQKDNTTQISLIRVSLRFLDRHRLKRSHGDKRGLTNPVIRSQPFHPTPVPQRRPERHQRSAEPSVPRTVFLLKQLEICEHRYRGNGVQSEVGRQPQAEGLGGEVGRGGFAFGGDGLEDEAGGED